MSSTITTRESPLNDGTEDLLDHARSIESLIRDEAAASEAGGQLTDKVVDALHDGGFFGLWVPLELGGSELSPRRSMEVLAQLSYADASTGWVVMAAALSTGVAGAYLPDAGVDRLFGSGRFPVIAGQGTRPGTAVPVDGGYDVTGSWSFASGVKHAAYIHTAAVIEGTNDALILNTPVEGATLIDNWDVMGLRATGSIDYTLDSVFVPEELAHPLAIDTPVRGGALYQLGIINFAGICHSGWALGVGRRMLDDLQELVQAKLGRPGQFVDSDAFHGEYAQAEARYRAARALLFETWADIEATLNAGEPMSVRQQTLNRLALNNVTWSVEAVSSFVYRVGGTTALRSGSIQRYYRDMHAGTQHITSSPPVLQSCGRELAGLAEGGHWFFLDFVDAD